MTKQCGLRNRVVVRMREEKEKEQKQKMGGRSDGGLGEEREKDMHKAKIEKGKTESWKKGM